MILGSAASILLVFLPGAWITFGLPLKGMPFWAKLLCGAILAPLVVTVQFYLLRLLGAPFELTTMLLPGLNLPAAYLIFKQRANLPFPDRRTFTAGGVVLLVILACIASFLLDPQKRGYTWEIWSQADVVYSIANGNLDLEDAELAGVRLSYPWAGHVYQAILSYLLGSPPVSNYIWTNLLWLVFIFGFAAGIVAELGGNRLSQVTIAVWLSFGVNFVGAVLGPIIPEEWVKAHASLGNIWGDNRYTPWLDKVLFFNQMYFALGFFVVILYFMIKPEPDGYKRNHIALIGLLLAGIGIIYPVLLPPACAVVGARVIVMLSDRWSDRSPVSYKAVLGLGAVIVLAGVVTYANTMFLTAGRASASLVHLNDLQLMRWRVAESLVVTGPLLAGLGLVYLRLWKEKRRAIIILGFGALVSFILYTLFDIPWWRNEYKFIFTAAICLAPFPSLALEPVMQRLGRWALPGLAILTLILASPFAQKVYVTGGATKEGPLLDMSRFDLRLVDQNPYSGLTDAIRQKTPVNSLLVLVNAEIYFPTLTQRQLYVAPVQSEPHPGILITSDEMLTLVKGYPSQTVTDRRLIVQELFDSNSETRMALSLKQILQFDRPLVLVLDEHRHAVLLNWLAAEEIGRPLYRENGVAVWLVEPGEAEH